MSSKNHKAMVYLYIPSLVVIGQLVPEKKIFKGFYHIWKWRPSWSCDLDFIYTFVPLSENSIDVSHKILAVSEM